MAYSVTEETGENTRYKLTDLYSRIYSERAEVHDCPWDNCIFLVLWYWLLWLGDRKGIQPVKILNQQYPNILEGPLSTPLAWSNLWKICWLNSNRK